MIRYISTRGQGTPQSFPDTVLTGLAPDGGLYIPDSWPELDRHLLALQAGTPYTSVAATVMAPFIGDSLSPVTLAKILSDAYEGGAFHHSAIAPLTQIGPNTWMLELFHGPTLSFKDYALQFIGRLYDHLLEESGERLTIIGATSGDTGSAAIEALRHSKNITTFILHPHDRISEVQRRQMTSIDAPNVFNIAVEGNFDDCQTLVKAMLGDRKLAADLRLSAVNSINWARIMAQSVYYVYAAIALGAPDRQISFSVPTGNFGNVYAGWCAKQIGLPIHQLIIGSNRNDILTRFFETGEMRVDKVMPSLSPSMDIQISSNFERFLCDLMRRDHVALDDAMNDFKNKKAFKVDPALLQQVRRVFNAERATDPETLQMMRECYEHTGMLIDPHTAVGLHAMLQSRQDPTIPAITLACAHPAKFPDAVEQATGIRLPLPDRLGDLMDRPEYMTVMPNDLQKLTNFIRSEAKNIT